MLLWVVAGSFLLSSGKLIPLVENPIDDAVGLAEIVEGLGVPTVTVVLLNNKLRTVYEEFLRMVPGLLSKKIGRNIEERNFIYGTISSLL